jgi:hypothetical protein
MTSETNKFEELELRLNKLEELIRLTLNKELYKNLYKEHKRLLNSQYSMLLSSLKEEFKKSHPTNVVNLKKLILSNLPMSELHISEYIKTLENILVRHNISYNVIEIEVFLLKTGALKNDKVCKTNIPEKQLRDFLHVL